MPLSSVPRPLLALSRLRRRYGFSRMAASILMPGLCVRLAGAAGWSATCAYSVCATTLPPITVSAQPMLARGIVCCLEDVFVAFSGDMFVTLSDDVFVTFNTRCRMCLIPSRRLLIAPYTGSPDLSDGKSPGLAEIVCGSAAIDCRRTAASLIPAPLSSSEDICCCRLKISPA